MNEKTVLQSQFTPKQLYDQQLELLAESFMHSVAKTMKMKLMADEIPVLGSLIKEVASDSIGEAAIIVAFGLINPQFKLDIRAAIRRWIKEAAAESRDIGFTARMEERVTKVWVSCEESFAHAVADNLAMKTKAA